MAELNTATTHTLLLTTEELDALRSGMKAAVAATSSEPNKHKHREQWQKLARVGESYALRETEDARHLPVWGGGQAPTQARRPATGG